MTREQFAIGMEALHRQFGASLTPDEKRATMDTFWFVFQRDDGEAFLNAVQRALREWTPPYGRQFPLPGDVTRYMAGAPGAAGAAQSAWLRVWKAVTEGPFGEYSPVYGAGRPTGEGLDEVTLAAIGYQGGLRLLWDVQEDPERVGYMRRDFMEAYTAAAGNVSAGLLPDGRDSAGRLPGPSGFRALSDNLGKQLRLDDGTARAARVEQARALAARAKTALREAPRDPKSHELAELAMAALAAVDGGRNASS